MIAFVFYTTSESRFRSSPKSIAFDSLVELDDKPVAEVLRHATAVLGCIAHYGILLGNDLDI